MFNSRPGHLGLSLGKTVYSILPQSTQLLNGYLALIWRCLMLVRYMVPAALEMVSVCTGLPGKEGRVNIAMDTRRIPHINGSRCIGQFTQAYTHFEHTCVYGYPHAPHHPTTRYSPLALLQVSIVFGYLLTANIIL